MRVIVAGDFRKGILLDTTEASALLIQTDDGQPNMLVKMMENGQGWLRLTKGEDKNFEEAVKALGLE
jgi:hypothetical protein